MTEVSSVESCHGVSIGESPEEGLEKAIENLSEYLFASNSTGWSDDYGAYLVLKSILSDAQNNDTARAFNQLEHKVHAFCLKQFFFVWDHIDFIQLISQLQQSAKPTIPREQLKEKLMTHLNGMFAEIDEACKGRINNQFSLSLIYGQLVAIGFILQDTELSPDLKEMGKTITNTYFFNRFGAVDYYLYATINHLLDLLGKTTN